MSEEFSAGVKILLQRMETNPEEFHVEFEPNKVPRNPKWGNMMSLVVSAKLKGDPVSDTIFLTPAEVDALFEGYKKIRRKAFDDSVMRSVLTSEESELSSSTSGSLFTERMRLDVSGGLQIGTVAPGEYASIRQATSQLAASQLAASQQQMMNAYPYSNYPYDEEPAQQGFGARVKKAIGIK